MKCPICNGTLEQQQGVVVCLGKCSAYYTLHYEGYTLEKELSTCEKGREAKEWLSKFGNKLNELKEVTQ